MGTRGAITFVSNGIEKTTYNHCDSYPSGLGVDVLKWLRSNDWNLPTVRTQVDALLMVDDQTEPTPEERERFAQYADINVSTGKDWYSLLRETQGNPAAILDAGAATDAAGFPMDSLFCEWAYVVDLDREVFEVYKGFRQSGPSGGRWSSVASPGRGGYWPVSLVKSWPIAELRASDDTSWSFMNAIESDGDDEDDVE